MAATGIRLRRKPQKGNFSGVEAPVIGELVMATDTTEFGWTDETSTTIWGRLENELPIQGTTGQLLAKTTDNDFEVEWIDAPVSAGGSSWTDFEVTLDVTNNWTPVLFTEPAEPSNTYYMLEVVMVSDIDLATKVDNLATDTNFDYYTGSRYGTTGNLSGKYGSNNQVITAKAGTRGGNSLLIISQTVDGGVNQEFRIGIDGAYGSFADDTVMTGKYRLIKSTLFTPPVVPQ